MQKLLRWLFVPTLVALAAVSGMPFYLWPTYLGDHELTVTPRMLEELQSLLSERKFAQHDPTFYPGAMNERSRAEAQLHVDRLLVTLIRELPQKPKRSFVMKSCKMAMANFDTIESEERDRFAHYLRELMNIVGVNAPGELLNVWRYGLPVGWFAKA